MAESLDAEGAVAPGQGRAAGRSLLARALAAYIRFVARTSTVVADAEDVHACVRAHHPTVMACWHGQFLMAAVFQPEDVPVTAMVARHKDAELVSQLMQGFGVGLVRGAGAGYRRRDRGGAQALRGALKALKAGSTLFMTADVPPGPARKAGLGVVTLARMSGRPVLPVAVATSRYKAFSSWSRFTFNLPFSRLGVAIGEPVFVARDARGEALEAARQLVEERLNQVTARAYELAGAPDPWAVFQARAQQPSRLLGAYAAATRLLGPRLAPALLRHRRRRGKEDPMREGERHGRTQVARPVGALVWVHAASVGETMAVLPLLRRLGELRADLHFLLTTGTRTSAELVATRLPERVIHQFVPLDVPQFVSRFLAHWQPDLALLVESEIWPNLIMATAARGCPLVLLNGRLSKRSFRRWRRFEGAALPLFGRFDLVLAQNEAYALHFARLGAKRALAVGNLKLDAPPPACDAGALRALRDEIGGRPVVFAASTHPGEEEMVAAAHRQLAARFPGLLTIIAPRHPERGTSLASMLTEQTGLSTSQRSKGSLPGPGCEIYIADTIGELGLFYRLAQAGLIGGSLVRHGGQNPIEAILSDMPLVTGPHHFNFTDVYKPLLQHGGARLAEDAAALAETWQVLLGMGDEAAGQRARARAVIAEMTGALERTVAELRPYLPALPVTTKEDGEGAIATAGAAANREGRPRAS